MNAQNDASPGWEYVEIQVTNPASTIREYRGEGWELVSAMPVPVTPAAGRRSLAAPRSCVPLAIAAGLIMLLVLFFTFLGGRPTRNITLSELAQDVQAGRVTSIVGYEDSNRLTVYYGDPSSRDTAVAILVKEPGVSIIESLFDAGVPPEALRDLNITIEPASSLGNYLGIAGFCLPPILIIAVIAWVGWRLLTRMQQWSTLLIFRRPAEMVTETAEQAGPAQH
ncbi:MAG: hypothetical protein M3437_13995 [Chloroflexota bacterium]|nr:hypothetical protein [Chloroflexota bacterium]MDQ5864468.1 hypothetical protein [Chloroflexota bacterium]